MLKNFSGVFSVLPTPFTTGGEVDTPSLRRVVDLSIRAGVDGLTACGVTSETSKLEDTERQRVLETIMEHVKGRVPVVVGTSSDGLSRCVGLSRGAKAAGAAAVMISPPRMPKLASDAVVRHYRAVADAVDIPIIIQDYPPVSGFTMESGLLVRIAREVPSARTIKLEDPPTPLKTARVLAEGADLHLSVFGGLGGVYLLEELMAGAAGAMTGFAVPEVLVRIVRLFGSGDVRNAAELFYGSVALMRFEFQEGIGMAIRKEILRRRGALSTGAVRPPGVTLDPGTLSALDSLLQWFCEQHGDLQWTLD